MSSAALRRELTPVPERMRDLPLDRDRGFLVPWFVAWVDGKPEFRAMDPRKWIRAVRESLCWVCGKPMGSWKVFVAGGMCGISRTSSEPPSHRDCAVWSAQNCPFLTRPHMHRREDDLVNNQSLTENAAGVALTRNPGVVMLWTTRAFTVFKAKNGLLIEMGIPNHVEWLSAGRPATRAEVEESITGGLPHLEELARLERGGLESLYQRLEGFRKLWLPSE